MVTLHITMESTTRPVPTASCQKTPPSSLTASPRDDIFTSSVSSISIVLPPSLICEKNPPHCFRHYNISEALHCWLISALPRPLIYSPCCFTSSCSSFTARTGTLEPSELEVFKKQAECLNFLPEYHFVGTGQSSFQLCGGLALAASIVSVNCVMFFSSSQICVRTTGKLPQPQWRTQRTVETTLSLLRSEAEPGGARRGHRPRVNSFHTLKQVQLTVLNSLH